MTGIKSDAIFNYWPPINILAVLFLGPIRPLLTPRKFHSVNVLLTSKCPSHRSAQSKLKSSSGICACPILLLIALYERRIFGESRTSQPLGANAELRVARGISRFEARADVEALLSLFINDDEGTRTHGARARHLSVSSLIESASVNKDDPETESLEWKEDLKQRLERIEEMLSKLSPTD